MPKPDKDNYISDSKKPIVEDRRSSGHGRYYRNYFNGYNIRLKNGREVHANTDASCYSFKSFGCTYEGTPAELLNVMKELEVVKKQIEKIQATHNKAVEKREAEEKKAEAANQQ